MTFIFLISLLLIIALIVTIIGEEEKIKDLKLEVDSYKAVAKRLEEILYEELKNTK